MIKLIDVVYYSHNNLKDPRQVLEKHAPSMGFVDFIRHKLDIQLIKHLDYEGKQMINGVQYVFFKSSNKFWHIPFKTHQYIKSQQPDVIIIQGLIFPLQVIALRMKVGKNCKIIVQHHGERPFTGIKKILQKAADRYISAYIFTSLGNAREWVDKKIIKAISKCHEVLEASTSFTIQNEQECKKVLQLEGDTNFLWVGRLNYNKDPLTVLIAFEKFIQLNPNVKLYMIYQTDDLLKEVKAFIAEYPLLKNSVVLKGKIPHNELECWYTSADFYISASNKESCGYALLEAMACGCIPVVTSIPSFKKITGNGKYGFLFSPGEPDELLKILSDLKNINTKEFSDNVAQYFKNTLSFKNIADDLYNICRSIISK